jgi:glycosyltransferase involved in cell wall biosynthesis
MNRIVTTNLEELHLQRLPPPRRDGPARLLFIHGNILGFRTVAAQLKRYCAQRPDIDAVHIDLAAPLWMKVAGKSLPVPGGWDLHSYRYLHLWAAVMRRWLRGPLPPDRFDLVHCMTQGNAWAFITDPRARGLPLAVNVDGTAAQDVSVFGYAQRARAPFIRAERRMFDQAALVVCRNSWVTRSLLEDYRVPEERLHVAPNSIALPDACRWAEDRRPRDGLPRLVYVGTGWKRKGGDLVLRVHQRHFRDRAQLHLFGGKLRRDARARNVVWHGLVPRDRLVSELLPQMDVLVLASRMDMLPWAALEAASVGLPVVGPRLGAIPDVVVAGRTGELFEPGDEAGLVEALRALVDDPERRERLGRAARRHIGQHFDPDRTYPALLDRLVATADRGST